MREIKFRAWDKTNKRMFDWDTLKNLETLVLPFGTEFQMPITIPLQDIIENDNFIMMQYIGIRDRNNKEIYEYDIVEQEINYPTGTIKSRGVVKFFNYMGQLGYRMQYALKYSHNLIDPNCQVIGNVYENGIMMGKDGSDIYIDDKSYRPEKVNETNKHLLRKVNILFVINVGGNLRIAIYMLLMKKSIV